MLARASRKPSLTLLGAVALVVAIANPAAAPPGDLDTTFDSDGQVTTSEHSGVRQDVPGGAGGLPAGRGLGSILQRGVENCPLASTYVARA